MEVPNGSISCPKCGGRHYEQVENNAFRCTSCNAVVDSIGQLKFKGQQKNIPTIASLPETSWE